MNEQETYIQALHLDKIERGENRRFAIDRAIEELNKERQEVVETLATDRTALSQFQRTCGNRVDAIIAEKQRQYDGNRGGGAAGLT